MDKLIVFFVKKGSDTVNLSFLSWNYNKQRDQTFWSTVYCRIGIFTCCWSPFSFRTQFRDPHFFQNCDNNELRITQLCSKNEHTLLIFQLITNSLCNLSFIKWIFWIYEMYDFYISSNAIWICNNSKMQSEIKLKYSVNSQQEKWHSILFL